MTSPSDAGSDQHGAILISSDGSDFSAGTERVGLEMGLRHQSQLILLRLLTAAPESEEAEDEQQEVESHIQHFTALCAERGISCTPLIRRSEGSISQAILNAAQETAAQMVVMGRRGRRGIARFMVGDATAKVLDKAECTVLVVPRLVSYWSNGVLLVLEEQPQAESDTVAQAAFQLAETAGLPLTILLVTEEDDSEAERRESYQLVNRLVAMAKLRGIETDGMVQSGDMDSLILEVARQRSVDLVVCEPRERSMMQRLFNTNNLVKLIGLAHCPVMVVKKP